MDLDWKTIAAWLGWIAASLMALVTSMLTFQARDVLKRVKHLEETKVGKDDLDRLGGAVGRAAPEHAR